MAADEIGEVIGVILLGCLVVAAVLAAIVIVAGAGSVIGTGVGFANYCKALYANVRLERPRV